MEGEKTYFDDQLIVWFNQAINCCILFLAEFSVVLMKIPNLKLCLKKIPIFSCIDENT